MTVEKNHASNALCRISLVMGPTWVGSNGSHLRQGWTVEPLSITDFSSRFGKCVAPRELRLDTSTMSACSRGALSKALRLDILRLKPRYPCRHAFISVPLRRITPSANFVTRHDLHPSRCFSTTPFRRQTTVENLTDVLPVCCPGCGAFSQTIEPDEPGYYGASRKQTRKLLASRKDAIEETTTKLGAEGVSTEQTGVEGADEKETAAPRPIRGTSPNEPSISTANQIHRRCSSR